MKPSRRVIFINRFYWPEQPATAQLLTDLAEGLARDGLDVQVLTRLPPQGSPEREERQGVKIVRLRASSLGRASLAGRMLDFTTFLRGVRQWIRDEVNDADTVVCMTDPPMLGAAVAGSVMRRKGRLVHWVQDIFPEVARAVSGVPFLSPLVRWRDEAWRSASRCVAPGEDMAAFIRDRRVREERVHCSPNWAPAGVGPADGRAWRAAHNLTDAFVVMYSGNLGRVHDFSAIVPLARRLAAQSRARLVFVGSGARRPSLESEVEAAGLRNVVFLPAQARERLAEVLSAADVHLVTLRSGCENLVFPSKLYGIAAVGRPVLVISPPRSEIGRIVQDAGFGLAVPPARHDDAAGYLLSLADNPEKAAAQSAAAQQFAEPHLGPARAIAEWSRYLCSLQ